jgi:hypothetical protein
MNDVDPITGNIEQLQASLTSPAQAAMAGNIATVEVGPDGSIHAIRLTDLARRLDPDTLVETIVRLHASALAESRKSVAEAVARLENDPRLRARREQMIDALNQPLPPRQAPAAPAWPQQAPAWPAPPQRLSPPTQRREPTPEEDEEMDRYYQRKSWLEY